MTDGRLTDGRLTDNRYTKVYQSILTINEESELKG
jgi:hypothetical protein